jgi:putative transposase
MFVAERFLSNVIKQYGKNIRFLPVAVLGIYPQARQFLKLNHHHIHSSYEKSIIERMMQYIKGRTECFDDYFPCRKKEKLQAEARTKMVKSIRILL